MVDLVESKSHRFEESGRQAAFVLLIHTHTHTHTHTRAHTRTHSHTRAHTRARTRTHTHTHNTHTHTYLAPYVTVVLLVCVNITRSLICVFLGFNLFFPAVTDLKLYSVLHVINPLNAELNPICYLLALLAHHFLHVSRIRVKSLTHRQLMSYIYMEHLFLMFLDHTQRRSTVGRTPLDE